MKKFKFRVGHIAWKILHRLSDIKAGTFEDIYLIESEGRTRFEYRRSLKLLSEQKLIEETDGSYRVSMLGYEYITYLISKQLSKELGRSVR